MVDLNVSTLKTNSAEINDKRYLGELLLKRFTISGEYEFRNNNTMEMHNILPQSCFRNIAIIDIPNETHNNISFPIRKYAPLLIKENAT